LTTAYDRKQFRTAARTLAAFLTFTTINFETLAISVAPSTRREVVRKLTRPEVLGSQLLSFGRNSLSILADFRDFVSK
jgi:hypothetical protein